MGSVSRKKFLVLMVSQGKNARKRPCVACVLFVKEYKREFEEIIIPKG